MNHCINICSIWYVCCDCKFLPPKAACHRFEFGNQPLQGKKFGVKVAYQLHLPKSHKSGQLCALGTTFNWCNTNEQNYIRFGIPGQLGLWRIRIRIWWEKDLENLGMKQREKSKVQVAVSGMWIVICEQYFGSLWVILGYLMDGWFGDFKFWNS